MKKLLVLSLLLLCSLSLQAATVSVTNGTSVDPEGYDASRFLIRDGVGGNDIGNPTAQEIQAFKDGTLDLVRFVTDTPVLNNADVDLLSCAAAINTICSTLSESDKACSVTPTLVCVGVCLNSVRIRIVD